MSAYGRLDSNSIINKKFDYDYNFFFTADNDHIYYNTFEYTIPKGSILSIEKFDLLGNMRPNLQNQERWNGWRDLVTHMVFSANI